MKIVDIFFTTLQEQWLKQRLDLEQRYPHEIVPLSSFSWNFYKPLMRGYFITFLGCDKLITETVIRVVDERIKTFEIAVDSLWFVYVSLFSLVWVIRTSEAKWLSVTPKRRQPLSFFFFGLFCLFDFSLNYFWSFGFWRGHKTDWWAKIGETALAEKMFYSACLN